MMKREHRRIAREKRTITLMVRIACRGRHTTRDDLCDDCKELLDYALDRLEKCPYQESKPTCAKCPIHCYRPSRRERIRGVMRYAGPRMLFHHPFLALGHLADGMRNATGSHGRQREKGGPDLGARSD
jgi:hypothetical protein